MKRITADNASTNHFAAPSEISGRGLFSGREYRQGEHLFTLKGRLFDSQHRDDEWFAHSYQLDRDLYLYPESLDGRYINHSCQPNAGLREDLEMVALCDIPTGAEICFDYSTCMSEKSWIMDCVCGARHCRKRIGDFHDLPIETKQRYLKLGIVQRFIVREIFELAATASNSRITGVKNWACLAADILQIMEGRIILGDEPARDSERTMPDNLESNRQTDSSINILSNVA